MTKTEGRRHTKQKCGVEEDVFACILPGTETMLEVQCFVPLHTPANGQHFRRRQGLIVASQVIGLAREPAALPC